MVDLRLWLCWVLLLVALPATAEEVWIRNRPFQGELAKLNGELWVELKPIAKALDLKLVEENGGWRAVQTEPGEPGEIQPGSVLVGGQAIPVSQGRSGAPMVSLKAFCAASGAELKKNKDLGTIDVYVPSLTAAASADWGKAAPEEPLGDTASWQTLSNPEKGYEIKYPPQILLLNNRALMEAAMKHAASENPQDAPFLRFMDAEFVMMNADVLASPSAVLVAIVMQLPFEVTPEAEQEMFVGMEQRAREEGGGMLGKPAVTSLGGTPFKTASFTMKREGKPFRMDTFVHLSARRGVGYLLMVLDQQSTFVKNTTKLKEALRSFRVL